MTGAWPKKIGPKSRAEVFFEVFLWSDPLEEDSEIPFWRFQHFQVPCGFFRKVGVFENLLINQNEV